MQSRQGKFELAAGGTLFLDEIGELPLLLQSRFLRVIQERVFERVGGNRLINADVRVLAATNRDLALDVREHRFREDLYYRLNVFPVRLPGLHERRDGLHLLVDYLLKQAAAATGRSITAVEPEVMEKLVAYNWPGNIRELRNVIERAVILCKGRVTVSDLPEDIRFAKTLAAGPLADTVNLKERERECILETLAECGNNRRLAAEKLGISRRTLQYRLKEYGLVDADG